MCSPRAYGCGLCQSKKVDCALACIARGRAIRAVCMALGVSRSNVLTKKTRSSDWADLRKSPPKTIEWLTDNGSCYTAAETRSFAKELGLKPVTTPVTSPQSNGMAESFVKTLKRDYAKLANRQDSKTVMAQLKDWLDEYNSYHPHSALGYLPPTLFREKRSVT